MFNATAIERFHKSYRVEDSGCWIWTGSTINTGYGSIGIDGKRYLAHRMSHMIHSGAIPPGMVIDHICHVPLCVNPNHLQAVTRKENGENLVLSKVNSSGVRGVCWDKRNSKWLASVRHNYVRYHVGRFTNLADAEAAVIAKRDELFTNSLTDRRAVSSLTVL